MFTEYFANQALGLRQALHKNLEKKGIQLPGKEKDLNIYREFYDFIREHIPEHFSLATGKVRGKKHILNRNIDLLLYKKWIPRLIELSGGYVLADALYAFMSIETDLSTAALITHAVRTNAIKSLYRATMEGEDERFIPMFSVLFAYKSSIPLLSHKVAIKDTSREKGIELFYEIDMICILDQGLLIKDWENNGEYKVVETGEDTLLWFYILLLEYLDRDEKLEFNMRNYIKTSKEYKEY